MQLKQFRAKNWCQFKEKVIDFRPGLNLITGPNGSGKSNTLKGIYTALTGKTSRNEGVHADNITQGSDKDEPSLVEVDFEHNGMSITAMQSFRGVSRKRSLTVNGTSTYGDKAVAEELHKLLNLDEEILSNYIIIDQWELFSIFKMTPAKRAAAIQKLFRLDQAEEIYSILTNSISALPAEVIAVEVDEGREDVLQARLTTLETELSETLVISREEITKLDTRHKNAWQSSAARSALTKLQKQYQDLLASVEHVEPHLVTAKRQVASFETSLAQLLEIDQKHSATAQEWDQYERRCQHIQSLRDSRAKQIAAIDALIGPSWSGSEPPLARADLPGIAKTIEEAKLELAQSERVTNSFDASKGLVECPTCLTKVTSLQDTLKLHTMRSRTLKPVVTNLEALLKTSSDYYKAQDDFAKFREAKLSALASMQIPDDETNTPPTTERIDPELRKGIAESISSARQFLSRAKSQQDQAQTQLTTIKGQLAQIQHDIDAETITAGKSSEDPEALRTFLDAQLLAVSKREALTQRIQETKLELEAERERKAKFLSRKSRNLEVDNRRKELSLLRSLFHPQATPQKLASDMLAGVVAVTNEHAAQFGSPFFLTTTDDGSFMVHFADGRVVRPPRLSGGQGIVLALAFRLAINSTYASHLGLLCLDEPTVGLDTANLSGLTAAFDKLRELATATNLQIVVVSHEREIINKFDHVIELTKC